MTSTRSNKSSFFEINNLRSQYQALDRTVAGEDVEWPTVSVAPLGDQNTAANKQKNRKFWKILIISLTCLLLVGSVVLVSKADGSNLNLESSTLSKKSRDDDRSDNDSFLSGFPSCQTKCKSSCIDTATHHGHNMCCDWTETLYGSLTCSQTFDSNGNCFCTGQAINLALQADPTLKPSHRPTIHPSHYPSRQPVQSVAPSFKPSKASKAPSAEPSYKSKLPTAAPVATDEPVVPAPLPEPVPVPAQPVEPVPEPQPEPQPEPAPEPAPGPAPQPVAPAEPEQPPAAVEEPVAPVTPPADPPAPVEEDPIEW